MTCLQQTGERVWANCVSFRVSVPMLRPECVEHAMLCLARLVRVLLGKDAIENKKLDHGSSLVVLGAEIRFQYDHFSCRPAPSTVAKCMKVIKHAMDSKLLLAGDAQKLAGRLNWSTQHLFNRLGRAMLRPIYGQKFSRRGTIGPLLLTALRWWAYVLELQIAENRGWNQQLMAPVHLYVDARSTPPRCAAVIFIDGRVLFTDGPPGDRHMSHIKKRGDGDIMSLELMAIAVGLATFADELSGRQVWIFEDNTGAEATTQKGSSKADDHNLLVHEIWTLALLHRMSLWVDRVPSDDNLADLPSREEYDLLHKMGAVWRKPQIPDLAGYS